MKIAAVFNVMLLLAGACLAQSDSAFTADQQNIAILEKTAPAKTSSEPGIKWILGLEVKNLELKSFPGNLFLQRRISPKFFVSMGFKFNQTYDKPGEYYRPDDSVRTSVERRDWSLSLLPEIGILAVNRGHFAGGMMLRTGLTRARSWAKSENRDERQNYYYYTNYNEQNQLSYVLSLPVFLERRFSIRKVSFSVGIINEVLSVYGGWSKEKTKYTSQSWSIPELVIEEDEHKMRSPVYMYLKNPFGEYVRVFVKFYL